MAENSDKKLHALEELLSYRFKDPMLLQEAITHSSYLNEASDKTLIDNERLEFLGDSVLSMFVSLRLFSDFTEKREGELTRMRSSLVDESSLAEIAREMGFGEYLKLGRGEERTGGRLKSSLLADAFEAILGALYLDGGIDAVTPLLESLYSRLSMSCSVLKDFKTALQEFVQSDASVSLRYILVSTSGPDHDRIFNVDVMVGENNIASGSGKSRKQAEQEAAKAALSKLQHPNDGGSGS